MIISSSLKNGKTAYQSDGKLPYHADRNYLTEEMGKVLVIYKDLRLYLLLF